MLAAGLRLLAKHGIGAFCDKLCHEKGQRRKHDDDKGYADMYGQHEYQCSDNSYNACKKLSKSEQQSVRKLVCVGDDAADNLPGRGRIKIGKGQLLYFFKSRVSDIPHGFEGDAVVNCVDEPL